MQVTNLAHPVPCKDSWACCDNLSSRIRGTVGHGAVCWNQQDTRAAPHPQPNVPAQHSALLSVQPSSGSCELCSISSMFSESRVRYPWSASRLLLFVCCYQQMGTLTKPQMTAASREKQIEVRWTVYRTFRVEEALKVLESNHFFPQWCLKTNNFNIHFPVSLVEDPLLPWLVETKQIIRVYKMARIRRGNDLFIRPL